LKQASGRCLKRESIVEKAMAVIDVLSSTGKKVSQRELPDDLFGVPARKSLLHEVVTMQLANRRSATASVKHRSDISGSTRKLFRQKGTGRARRGDIKSPLLRGGGVVFGPDDRKYTYRVPKKVRRLALKMALSSKLQDSKLVVLDRLELEQIKTKAFLEVCKALNIQNALIVTDKKDLHLELSSRNVPTVKVLRSEGLNVYDILKYDNLVLLEPALNDIEGRLGAS
jgi:large subunit ribosomal protein L4